MRLFLAINLPPELRRDLWNAATPLRESAPDVSWVREPLIHLTLKFFGDQPESAVETLAPVIAELASKHGRPLMRIGEIGAFPTFRRARVIWVGVERDPRLELLHHDAEIACERLGYEIEGRPFRPHLTIGRVRDRAPSDTHLRELARVARKVRIREELIVQSIDLMESTMGEHGREYRTVLSSPLRRE